MCVTCDALLTTPGFHRLFFNPNILQVLHELWWISGSFKVKKKEKVETTLVLVTASRPSYQIKF